MTLPIGVARDATHPCAEPGCPDRAYPDKALCPTHDAIVRRRLYWLGGDEEHTLARLVRYVSHDGAAPMA